MQGLAGRGMFEGQHEGMQSLAREAVDDGLGIIRQQIGLGPEGRAVIRVADQRMADMGHVDADLMGAACFEIAADHGGQRSRIRFFVIALDDLIVRDRLTRIVVAFALDGALDPVAGAAERRVDRSLQSARAAPDNRHIGTLQRPGAAMVSKLVGEMAVSQVVLGDNHDAARILVEAVDDAGPLDATDA